MEGLAYIGQIVRIDDIENADYIQSASVDCGAGGKWGVVIRKGDFEIGDLCEVYLQDSLLPEHDDRFDFMAKNNYRVRMMRLRGVPSEALVMPVQKTLRSEHIWPVGTDITSVAGVFKYEKPLPTSIGGDVLGHFPSFIPKTDEPNFQKVPHLLDALEGNPFVATVKYDGTSATAYRNDDHIGVCGRNYELKEDDKNTLWRVTKESGIYEVLKSVQYNIAFQFEVIGPGIQKNPMGLDSVQARVFDIYDITEQGYMSHYRYRAICAHNHIPTVKLAMTGNRFEFTEDQLRAAAEIKYDNGRHGEGLVFRSRDPMHVLGERVSFKVINLNYRD